MILIISDNDDNSTNDVIDWLIYKNIAFCRINRTDAFDLNYVILENGKYDFEIISVDKKIKIKLSELTGYWYRRGYLNLHFKNVLQTSKYEYENNLFYQALNNYLTEENKIIVDCIYELLQKLQGFGKFYEGNTNKLVNLLVAESVGLKIPETIVSKKKDALLDFNNKSNTGLITKSLNQSGGLSWHNQLMHGLTEVVISNDIEKTKSNWPSFLQRKINKLYEIRLFYLDKKIFAAAIFSQSNMKTNVDFRNYDKEKPNRVVPYILPGVIQQQIIRFMENIDMKSGSIDLVVDQNNNYVFLEVNPIGQFAQVSIPCNYYIEDYIANYFMNGKN